MAAVELEADVGSSESNQAEVGHFATHFASGLVE